MLLLLLLFLLVLLRLLLRLLLLLLLLVLRLPPQWFFTASTCTNCFATLSVVFLLDVHGAIVSARFGV